MVGARPAIEYACRLRGRSSMAECGPPRPRRGFDPFRPLGGPVAEWRRNGRGTVLHPGSSPGRASNHIADMTANRIARERLAAGVGGGVPPLAQDVPRPGRASPRARAGLRAAGVGIPARLSRPAPAAALLGVAMAALLEVLQAWAPGRHAYFSDFMMNAIGVGAGARGRRAHRPGAARATGERRRSITARLAQAAPAGAPIRARAAIDTDLSVGHLLVNCAARYGERIAAFS